MRSITLSLAISFVLLSCQNNRDIPNHAYLSGTIINSSEAMAYLKYKGMVIDSSAIDEDNKFNFKLDSLENGLYEFSHDKERQLLYLSKGDSLLMYSNSVFFDESLSYSGYGDKRNNFLISLFLQNEKSREFHLQHAGIDHIAFERYADSIKTLNLNKLAILAQEENNTSDFQEFARKAVMLNYWDFKESYLYTTAKFYPKVYNAIPKSYFGFRSQYDFNDEDISDYYINFRLLNNYLKNNSVQQCLSKRKAKSCFNLYTYESIEQRALLLDSLTEIKPLKYMLFNRLGRQGTILANDTIVAQKTIALLESLKYTDTLGFQEVKNLAAIQRIFLPGANVSSVGIIDVDGNRTNLKEVLKKPTVIHSWRTDYESHHRESHKKLMKLKLEYPNIDFIGITTEAIDFTTGPAALSKWRRTLEEYGYNPKEEYHIITNQVISGLLNNYKNKVLFINKDGTIQIGATLLQSEDFDEKIEAFSQNI